MIVGVPKEVKADEYRVAIVPAGVELLTSRGHQLIIEKGAGVGSGILDVEYAAAGAHIVESSPEVHGKADLLMKVKEPLPEEWPLLREGQVVFTYFHFAADRALTEAMLKAKVVAIAYETIGDARGGHPLLTPMSEVAGRMAIQEGAKYLEKPMEGRGILLGGVPGVEPARVTILGGGVVGTNAAKVAAGLGAQVSILDTDLHRLRYLADIMPSNVVTLMSDLHTVRAKIQEADLVIGAVLILGGRTPVLVRAEDLQTMKPGAVIVDVSVDQGGSIETSKPTTHSHPTFVVDGVVHYCVTNMPGAVGRTSTYALTNATLPIALTIADKGYELAAASDPGIKNGVNMVKGELTNQAVAESFGLDYRPL